MNDYMHVLQWEIKGFHKEIAMVSVEKTVELV